MGKPKSSPGESRRRHLGATLCSSHQRDRSFSQGPSWEVTASPQARGAAAPGTQGHSCPGPIQALVELVSTGRVRECILMPANGG